MTRMASLFRQTRWTVVVAILSLVTLIGPDMSQAQTTDITSSGLGTEVRIPTTLPDGTINYDITGGTRPGGGANLFHSFGEFSVGNNNIANFLNETNMPTENILSRVTGGNPSNIFGTIQTTNFGAANLYLINPAGIMFGTNATLNVGGSVNISTADYLKMIDGATFFANPAQPTVLSLAPVAAFGFLGANPGGTITVQGGTVNNTSTLTLVGRDIVDSSGNTTTPGIAVTGGTLSNPAGRINLVSVGTPQNTAVGGEINVGDLNPSSTLRFNSMGIIQLFPNTSIITTANAAGPIFIRAGRLVMDASSRLRAATMDARGGNITIEVQRMGLAGTSGDVQDFSMGAFVSTSSFGSGQGGDIIVNATESVTITDNHTGFGSLPGALTGLFSTSSKTGNSGKIFVSTPALSITGLGGGITTQTFSTEAGGGRAGDITLDVGTLILRDGAQLLSNTGLFSTGNAGNLNIFASDLVDVDGGPSSDRLSRINSGTSGFGDGGNILIESPRLMIDRGTMRAESDTQVAKSGNITIDVDHLTITNGEGILTTSGGPAGDIVIKANESIEISRSRGISSQAFGPNNAGNIYITTPTLSIGGDGLERAGIPNGINSSTGSTGAAGNIVLNVDKVTLTNAAEITSSSISNLLGGNAGTITLQGSTGRGSSATTVSLDNSTISTTTAAPNPTNTPANIEIKAQTVTLDNGAQIKADTSGAAPAGNIALNVGTLTVADSIISSSSSSFDSQAGNSGTITIQGLAGVGSPATSANLDGSTISTVISGGSAVSTPATIAITADDVTLLNKTQILAFTDGAAPAGNIDFNVNTLTANDGVVESSTLSRSPGGGRAGAITIRGDQGSINPGDHATMIILDDVLIDALTFGSGAGGSINITADTLKLQNTAQITATTLGSGDGGNLIFNVNRLTASNSEISSFSALIDGSELGTGGRAGSVTIRGDQGAANHNDSATSVALDDTFLSTSTLGAGAGGPITVTADTLNLENGTSILATTFGSGNAGDIALNINTLTAINSDIASNSAISTKDLANPGRAGTVAIRGDQGTANPNDFATSVVLDKTSLDTATRGAESGGAIMLAANTITLRNAANIQADTSGDADAGSITLRANRLTAENATISSGSGRALDLNGTIVNEVGNGRGGDIRMSADTLTLQKGSVIQTDTAGPGDAGAISLNANTLTAAQATISTRSAGPDPLTAGNAGDITLTSAGNLTLRNSTVTTTAAQASGGNIKLTAPNLIRLVDSTLTSSVQGQAGSSNGGNITIDPQFVILQNSPILAQAFQGNGGNITIVATRAVLVDPNSPLDASSTLGISGNVNIDAPIQVLSGTLVPLNLAYSQAGLSGDRCAADPTGQFSSFVQAGRDGVPQVPGALSPSPLSFLDPLTSGSWGLPRPNMAAARLGLNFVSVNDSTPYRFHSACRS